MTDYWNTWVTAKYSDRRTRACNFRSKTVVELIDQILTESIKRNRGKVSVLETVLVNNLNGG